MENSILTALLKKPTWTLEESWLAFNYSNIPSYEDIFRSDINLHSGGVTTVEGDYDQRTGKALSFIPDDLEKFIDSCIAKGDLNLRTVPGNKKRYFEPKEIILLLEKYTGEKASDEYYKLILSKTNIDQKPACERVKECYEQHGSKIIQNLKKEKGKLPKKREVALRMQEEYLQNIKLGTIEKNFSYSRESYQKNNR